jgi:hydrogenase maturation protease
MTERIVIVALGNELRGDDAFGPVVLDHLRRPPIPGAALGLGEAELWRLSARSDPPELLIVIDAAVGLEPVGPAWRRLRLPQDAADLAHEPTSGTHTLPLPAVLQLLDAVGRAAPETWVYAVRAEHFESGAAVGASERDTCRALAGEIRSHIGNWTAAPPRPREPSHA